MKRKRSLVFLLITAALLSLLAVFLHFTSDDDPGVSPVLPPSFTPVLGAVVEGAEVPATEAPKSTRSPVDGELPDNAQPVSDADRMAIAVKFVGRPVEELTAALGGPARVSYTPSASAAVPNALRAWPSTASAGAAVTSTGGATVTMATSVGTAVGAA